MTANIRTEQALALIEATRSTVRTSVTDSSAVPETAISIHPDGDGYMVSWGSPEGYEKLMVKGSLRADGNPTKPEDWQTRMFELKD